MHLTFLMYKKNTLLKETAEKRLQAIREFTDLGSGYKIAMRDLEIRGAGNLLGQAQSGHMEAVGYDLYCKMLNEAVLKLKENFMKRRNLIRPSILTSVHLYQQLMYTMNIRNWNYTNEFLN